MYIIGILYAEELKMENMIIEEKLKKYNQEHLLKYIKSLEENKKQEFLNQILELDLEQIKNLYAEALKKEDNKEVDIEPINCIDIEKIEDEEKNKYNKIGEDIIKNGRYAIVTMAGGQRNKTWI